MQKKKKDVKFEDKIRCPHCGKRQIVKRIRRVIVEPTKGEYEEETIVKKDPQKTLKESTKKNKK